MASIAPVSFGFSFEAHPDLPAQVLKFSGQAALNSLYRLKAAVMVPSRELSEARWEDFFATPCTVTIDDGSGRRGEGAQAAATVWTGLLTRLTTGIQAGDYTFLEIELVPSLGLLAGQIQNRIYLSCTGLEAVRDCLGFGGLSEDRFRLAARSSDYPKRDFIFQYEEDLLDFVWRTLQHDGLGLFYEQGPGGETAVITDRQVHFPSLFLGDKEIELIYAGQSGLHPGGLEPLAFNFQAETALPPRSLILKDYNWEDPNRPLTVRQEVSDRGRGEIHLYGENFASEAEGRRLAKIRQEECLSKCESYFLTAALPGFKPGFCFTLTGHPWGGFNGRYLTAASEFAGTQTGRLSSRLGLDQGQEETSFRQTLKVMKTAVPYRPERTVPRRKIAGSITAWIDGAGSGESPEIDGYGRYKVLLPLDISGRGDGKASAWVRMAQPYVGKGYGQNFPLTPGAEVLLTFIDGNPDRPVIAGAVANAENVSLINSSTSTLSGLGTKGGSALLFHETEGKQKLSLMNGSNRGGLTLNAGSPTSALLHSDEVSILNVNGLVTSANKSVSSAGSELHLVADNDWYSSFAALAMTAKTAANMTGLISSDFANTANSGKDEGAKEKSANVSSVTEKVAAAMGTTDTLFKLWLMYNNLQTLVKSPLKPHSNLVNISTSLTGAKAVLKSRKENKASLITLCSVLNNAVKIASDVYGVAHNEKDYEDYTKSAGEYEGNKKPGGDDVMRKRWTAATSDGTKITEALSLLTAEILLLASIYNFTGPAKGVVIDSSDSYVNIRAHQQAILSGSGPTVIESSWAPLSLLLKNGIVHDRDYPSNLISPDSRSLPVADFSSSKTLLLLGDLIRTRSQELSLQAYEMAVLKSGHSIQLVAGSDLGTRDFLDLLSLNRQMFEGYLLAYQEAATEPLRAAALVTLIEGAVQFYKVLDFQVPTDDSLREGVLLKTRAANSPIYLQTEKNAPIEIIQNSAVRPGADQVRRISLLTDKTAVQENNNVKLEMTAQEVKLNFNDTISLNLKAAETKLTGSVAASFISLKSGETVLSNPTKLTLTGSNNSLTIGTEGFAATVGGNAIKIDLTKISVG
ncbi:MAG: type VI secretion system tip protein VgrG [Deltaproteobacteria bacterium]|jgi:type VI secretion system VgrG family protein|nr:type VI secretion system tip protein VgrG [Deltaproteobacteria bacterium]